MKIIEAAQVVRTNVCLIENVLGLEYSMHIRSVYTILHNISIDIVVLDLLPFTFFFVVVIIAV